MKNKVIIIGMLLLFVGCENTSTNYVENKNKKIGGYEITIIEGCEYIVINYDRSRSITHKGNCKNHKPLAKQSRI